MLVPMWNRTLLALLLASSAFGQKPPKAPATPRLYVFDNGLIHGINPELFHLTKDQVAVSDMVVSSYLIVHPRGVLLWDCGAIPDSAIQDDGTQATSGLYVATKTLKSQLAAIGYAPKDITYFGLTHYHGDHTANANDYAAATWIVQQVERDAMFGEKAPPITQRERYDALKNSKAKILKGEDFDVFRDGSVVVKAAYGHTPGHQVVYLKLAHTGPILLAGDLYHYNEERGTDKTPGFEFSREQSLASREAMEAFIKKTGAQLWIEHDLAHFNTLKKAPAYLD